MRDPYDVLGVPRSADAAASKSAFRRLAKKHHPDANKTDPKAAQRFGELNTAYEILGDAAKRKAEVRNCFGPRCAMITAAFLGSAAGLTHAELSGN